MPEDVECLFGILRARWRFLKLPIQYQGDEIITAAMKTCCILNNILLLHNGNGIVEWKSNTNWDKVDPNLSADDFEDDDKSNL